MSKKHLSPGKSYVYLVQNGVEEWLASVAIEPLSERYGFHIPVSELDKIVERNMKDNAK